MLDPYELQRVFWDSGDLVATATATASATASATATAWRRRGVRRRRARRRGGLLGRLFIPFGRWKLVERSTEVGVIDLVPRGGVGNRPSLVMFGPNWLALYVRLRTVPEVSIASTVVAVVAAGSYAATLAVAPAVMVRRATAITIIVLTAFSRAIPD